jgi:3-oxoadipate enol-lactonase/4-carboxymuconolactone decarboxylase
LASTHFISAACRWAASPGSGSAIHHANRIGKLILANTSPHFPPPDMWDQRMAAVRDGGMMAISDAVLDRFFSPSLHQSQPGTVSDFRNVLEQTNPEGYLGCCGMLREADVYPELGKVSAPTLVISGRHDQSTPPERGEKIAVAINGAAHVILDAAHISNVERPQDFTRALAGFLGEVPLPDDETFNRGMARRRQVLGDAWVDKSPQQPHAAAGSTRLSCAQACRPKPGADHGDRPMRRMWLAEANSCPATEGGVMR